GSKLPYMSVPLAIVEGGNPSMIIGPSGHSDPGRTGAVSARREGSLNAEVAHDRTRICVPALRAGRGAFRLFVEGDELYDAMIEAIERSEHHIRMESYIFAADEVGERFVAALVGKARAGCHVHLHLDSFGAGFRTIRNLQRDLERAGGEFKW